MLCCDKNISQLESVRWGIANETDAFKQFYAKEATKHVDFKLEKCGLFVDKNRAYIGASPDDIMYGKCHGKSVNEIKCPFSIKDKTIEEGYINCELLTEENRNN